MISYILKLAQIYNNEVKSISLTPIENKIFDVLKGTIKEKAPNTTLRVAGGWVRDKLLGKNSMDIDIAINNMSGAAFASLVREYMLENNIDVDDIGVIKANPDQSKHLETAVLKIYGISIDFVNLRKETYSDSRIPDITPGTPEEDARRRDLTINSLFYNINDGEIEDFVGGLEDLKKGIGRTPLDPIQTFIDDPLRILRAIRFAAKYNLDLNPGLIEAAKDEDVQWALKTKISPERVWKELAGQSEPEGYKPGMLTGPDPHKAVKLLGEMGLRDLLLGLDEDEMKNIGVEKGMVSFDADQNNPHHDLTIWDHTLSVLKNLVEETNEDSKKDQENYLIRNLSALLHDIGKCDICAQQTNDAGHTTYHGHAESSAKIAEYVLRRLRAPEKVISRIKKLVNYHMRLHSMEDVPSDKALRNFIKDLEHDWKNSVDLAIADAYGKTSAKGNKKIKEKYINYLNRINDIISAMEGKLEVKSPVTGKNIMETLGWKPGPKVGKAIKMIAEKLMEDPNLTKEEAIDYIKDLED